MRIRSLLTVKSAIVVAGIFVILWVVAVYSTNLWLLIGMRTERQIIHAPTWLPYVASVLVIGFLVGFARTKSLAFGLLLFGSTIVWALSLRVLEVNGVSGEISQYWSDIRLEQDLLIGRDNFRYCYDVGAFAFDVRGKGGSHLRYFRGIWPAAFSRDDIRGALGLSECALPAS